MFRFQSVTSLGWQYAEWSLNIFNRLKSSYTDQNTTEAGGGYDHNTVGGYSVWDLTGTWSGVKGLSITAGVLNLFNETPPFSNQGSRSVTTRGSPTRSTVRSCCAGSTRSSRAC